METFDRILAKAPSHTRASIAYLTRDAHNDIHGHTARPQIFDTHWLSEAGDGHYLGAYWGSASGWEDALICLDSGTGLSTIPWEKNDYKYAKDAEMDFNELIARCNPTDRAGIQYITADSSGALFGHVVRPYTFEGHWRSPEGDGIYLGMGDAPDKWEECIIARQSKLGAFEAPMYAVLAGLAIVLVVWGYMEFIWDGNTIAGQPASQASAREVIAEPGALPASADIPTEGSGG